MKRVVSIDPGLSGCGVAIFSDGILDSAVYPTVSKEGSRVQRWACMSREVYLAMRTCDVLVVEVPRVYPGVRREDPNDLLDLTGVLGGILAIGCYRSAVQYYPSEWKGQVPKKVMNARVLSKLSEWERLGIANAGAKTHNILDAVGIGLHYLGRL